MRLALHILVHECGGRVNAFQHAPTLQPVGGALQLVRRDGRRVGDNKTALAQIRDVEEAYVGLSTLKLLVYEVVHIGGFVGVDPPDRFPYGTVERTVCVGINATASDFSAVIERRADDAAAQLLGEGYVRFGQGG